MEALWPEFFRATDLCFLGCLLDAAQLMWIHPSSAFCCVVPQRSSAETSTLRRIYSPILTSETDIREDANTHMVIQCKYPSRSFCTAVGWTFQTTFCLWGSWFSTHFCLLVLVAQRAERLLVLVLRCTLVPETALISSRKLTLCFPLIANSLFCLIVT